jgi:hypothetical protein
MAFVPIAVVPIQACHVRPLCQALSHFLLPLPPWTFLC